MATEAKDIFEAHSRSLRELLSENGLGLYLPPYQRPYGWSKDKVIKLIDDTLHGLKNLTETADSFTFLGTVITIHDINHITVQPVVKTEVPAKVLTVIDGQQRLSSLLMLVVSLHNQIRQRHWTVFKGKTPDADDIALTNLHEETIVLLQALGDAFYEKHKIGDSPLYPRLIRAFDDQWAKKDRLNKYESPIANLLFSYAQLAEEPTSGKPTDFKPKARAQVGDGEADLIKRFGEMRKVIIDLSKGKVMEEFEDLPSMSVLASGAELQRALFNHPLEDEFCKFIKDKVDGPEVELMRLVMLGAYVLNRIALTVVKGKDEDYAFTIFESLNTTGEPLTAFETFLPRVVSVEGLDNYLDSSAHEYMTEVSTYLSRFSVGDRLQNATRELLVIFALAESGTKLSKRLADQRGYMKDAFEKCKDDDEQRGEFLRHLRDTANFVNSTWDPENGSRSLAGLDADALTDTARLCLSFLTSLNHSVAIAPLVRFYSAAVGADDADRKAKAAEFEGALKAATAFTVFWRASRRTTGNIDSEYRELMLGVEPLTKIGPLARTRRKKDEGRAPAVDVEAFKAELAARLRVNGELPNLATFVDRASRVPIYAVSKPLARFLLLAAYHDAVEDPDNAGLIKQGKGGVSPCFTAAGWSDDGHLTLEHIAPVGGASTGWSMDYYSDKDIINRIGNMVLAPAGANSSLGARPWAEKKVLYGALGAASQDDAKSLLNAAQAQGIQFPQSTEELTQLSRYLPHLRALSGRDEMAPDFADLRGSELLKLVYARIGSWLDLSWSADGNDQVVPSSSPEEVEEDDEESTGVESSEVGTD